MPVNSPTCAVAYQPDTDKHLPECAFLTQELGHWDTGMNLQESHSAADKNHTHDQG
jgi:hypothetical protein